MNEARWWSPQGEQRVRCELCPRLCILDEGKAGYCRVRRNEAGRLFTEVYGSTSGCCVDPVEKKPLYHFLPGHPVFSFGTVGCNLSCVFCQNWGLSEHAALDALRPARPEQLAHTALAEGCAAVAFTYNEPAIAAEFCIDTAEACHAAGIRTIAVSSGYVSGEAREAFFGAMDAANVDLKGFSEAFYHRFCAGKLAPVLETLEYIARSRRTWLEITTLLIPGANDDPDEIRALCAWIREHLGAETPLHFSAFHPDHRLMDASPTPVATLRRSRAIALEEGLRFVYLGNIRDPEGSITVCPSCGEAIIVREGYRIAELEIHHGACGYCGAAIPGVFD